MKSKVKPVKSYEYGKSPNPTNWQEAADALKTLKPRSKNSLIHQLDRIEAQLKGKK